MSVEAQPSTWVFGYGSLIWRPGELPFVQKRWGYIKGWKRRFWQGSTDHRGVPGKPGRVVTLLRDPDDITWGICYEISAADWPRAAAYLDFRERGGYSRSEVEVYGHAGEGADVAPIRAVLYVAEVANPNYLGPAAVEEIARTIVDSVGPSGPNIDYFCGLAHALRDNKIHDPHVAEAVRQQRKAATKEKPSA